MLHPRSQFILLGGLAGLLLATACGGTKSSVCKEYFERAEQCAAKASPEKASMLRGLAKLAQEGFKDQNKPGVEESCREMLDSLNADPDCK